MTTPPSPPPPPTQLLMRRIDLEGDPVEPGVPAGYDIRLATEKDEPALARLLTAAFDEEWTVDRVQRSLTATPDVLAVYVVEWQGDLVATASSRYDGVHFPDAGYVHWVGTDPAHRGRQLGSVLMDRLLEDFRSRGYHDAVLETDTFRIPAIRVYLRHGYLPVYDVRGDDHRPRWSTIFRNLGRRR